MSRWDCIVVGGGCAGLAAATKLGEAGHRVLVLERRPLLGGRASSWRDRKSGETVDNGQHLFLGCYEETKTYLQRIGTSAQLEFWNSFSTPMVGPEGERACLKTWNLPAPWHLAMGLLGFRALSLRERCSTFRVAGALRKAGHGWSQKSVHAWLSELRQGPRTRARLWDLLTLATLNIAPEEAPAELLAVVLKNGFMASREASRIGLASVGLSDLLGYPARDYLHRRGGEVRLETTVASLNVSDHGSIEVVLSDGTVEKSPALVLAVPPPALRKLAGATSLAGHVEVTRDLHPSPIVSVHAWFNREPFAEPMVGFWGQSYHWAFRKDRIMRGERPRHVSLVTSAASSMLTATKEELRQTALREMRASLACPTLEIENTVVVREREATWIPPLTNSKARLATRTPITGIFLAGDWTDTGLPATIEGAVKSGHDAATEVASALTAK